MKKVVLSVLLSLVGWACLANVLLPLAGRPPLFNVPPKFSTAVTAVACFVALSLAWKSLKILGKIGLFITAAPVFLLGGVAGYMAGGPAGAVAGFVIPVLIALRWGIFGLAAGVAVAVGLALML